MKILQIAVAVALFGFLQHPDKANFAGRWNLDLKESKNLPRSFAQVESYVLDVRQTKDSLVVVIELTGGGQSVKFPVTNYLFDSSESFREDTLRHSKRWTRSSWSADGQQLTVTSRVEQGMGEKKTEYTERDGWKMNDPDKFTIDVFQKYNIQDSTRTEQRIFHRAK